MTRSAPLRAPLLALLLGLLLAGPASAQQQQPSKEERYDQAFQAGLQLLTDRKIDASIRAFGMCVQLFPDRPVAYYNLACAYSLKKDEQKAVEFLRQSFAKGFQDLSHYQRDMDLEPIRRGPAFRKAFSEFASKVLGGLEPALSHVPAGAKAPVLVYVPDLRDDPSKQLEDLRAAFPEWAILVPRGFKDPQRGIYYWDQRGEFVVTQRLRTFLREHPQVDASQAVIVGEGIAGPLAVQVAVHNPDIIGGVLAAGAGLEGAVDADLSDTRAYLVVHEKDPRQVAGGIVARNAFAQAEAAVVLERYMLDKPFSKDRALLLRGVGWLRGKRVTLPGAGDEHEL